MKIVIFSDGGARGNPGPAGIGAVLRFLDKETKRQKEEKISKYIGKTTNNQAEYQAVVEALSWVKNQFPSNQLGTTYAVGSNKLEDLEIECFLDSQLIVEQLNQRYKLKNEGLKPLFWEIRDLVMSLGGKVIFKYIPREQNKEADRLVNKAIDEHLKI